MTSNLGTEFVRHGGALGFLDTADEETAAHQEKIEKAMQDTFRPEFLNRLDEIIIFKTLSHDDIKHIVDLQMRDIADRLGEQGLLVELSEAARDWLTDEGYDPQFGARPLRRMLQRYVESPLSVKLLKGEFGRGDVVEVDVDEEGITFTKREGGSYMVPVEDNDEVDADLEEAE